MAQPKGVIGVDFGSTQSSVAYMQIGSQGIPKLYKFNGVDAVRTLLVLDSNDNSKIAWGNKVQDVLADGRKNFKFVSNFKRDLGTGNAEIDNYCRMYIKELADSVQELVGGANAFSAKNYETCFAYPASWSDKQVELLKTMAKDAGFPAVRAIKEPIAAMYALQTNSNFTFSDKEGEYFMVVDFGGGTLDICVIKTDISGRNPEIKATAGDPKLGGQDFDKIIKDLFFKQNNLSESNLSEQEKAEMEYSIRKIKEKISEDLKAGKKQSEKILCLRNGNHNFCIKKDNLESICKESGIYEKIENAMSDALKKARIDAAKIKKVILTGGSSQWFFVQQLVSKYFSVGSNNIFLTDNPFTDVANGCAICVGSPNKGPDRKGTWVNCWTEENGWGVPQCIFKPARQMLITQENRMHLCTLKGSHHRSRTIKIAWADAGSSAILSNKKWDDNDLVSNVSIITNTNTKWWGRLKDGIEVIFLNNAYNPLPDEYNVYLLFKESESSRQFYTLEIRSSEAEDALKKGKKVAKGKIESFTIYPGMNSTTTTRKSEMNGKKVNA